MTTTAPERPAPPLMDPRIEARRAAVDRERRRRRRNQLLTVLALVAVALALYGLTRSPLLDVDRIQVVGGELSGADAIRRAAGVVAGDQMLDISPGAARARVEALPWVRSARVVLAWPGTVRLVVSERRPVARIAGPDGRWWLADGTGRLLDEVTEPAPALVEVHGLVEGGVPGAQLTTLASAALAVLARLPPELANHTIGLRFGEPDDLQLLLTVPAPPPSSDEQDREDESPLSTTESGRNGAAASAGGIIPVGPEVAGPGLAVAHLGPLSRAPEKLAALETVLSQVELGCVAAIDVTVPDKPVLSRLEACR